MTWDGIERRADQRREADVEHTTTLTTEVAGLAGAVTELSEFVGRAATSEQVIRAGKANRRLIIAMTLTAVVTIVIVSSFIFRNQAINRQGVRCIVGQQALQRPSAEDRERIAEQLHIDLSLLPRLPEPDPEQIKKDCAPFLGKGGQT